MTDDQRLDGWKAIANFLGRERTTAIRWAKTRGLPVHRVPGGQTGTVYAMRSQVNAWLASEPVDKDDLASRYAADGANSSGALVQRKTSYRASAALAVFVLCAAIAGGWLFSRASAMDMAPVSIAAVASPAASPETAEFARALTADLARFANAGAGLAVFEREPGATPDTQYAVRREIERARDKIVAHTRVIAVPNGEVLWSRRFEQSQPALSTLREQIAANIVGILQCSFGTLDYERSKAQPADVALLMAICQDFEANDFPSAQTRARQLTIARPDLATGWAWLAVVQGSMIDKDPALKAQAFANAERARKIAPEKACTWLARAAVAGRGFTSPDALPYIEKGLETHPDHAFLLSQRSLIQFNLGYVQDSVAPALSAFKNDTSSLHGRNVAIRRLAAAGRLGEARQLQTENEKLWPDHPQTSTTRGLYLRDPATRQNADRDAIHDGEKAFSTESYVAYRLAHLYERGGDRRSALAWLARAPVKDAHQQWSMLFWPDAKGLRTDPAFFRKMADLGLVRWWLVRKQWPDFCSEPGLKYDCATEATKLGFRV